MTKNNILKGSVTFMKKKILPLLLLLTMIISMVTVKAENAEYSLINGGYVRLLGR